jgi:hypothetical protein
MTLIILVALKIDFHPRRDAELDHTRECVTHKLPQFLGRCGCLTFGIEQPNNAISVVSIEIFGVEGGFMRNRSTSPLRQVCKFLSPFQSAIMRGGAPHGRPQSRAPRTIRKKAATTMDKTKTSSKKAKAGASPSQLIDARIAALSDWRGETLARVRALIKQADPEIVEEWKWRGVPVWEHAGIICTGETYKSVVKLTFAKGASLKDPSGLFNSSLEGNVRRAIDFHEGDKIDAKALKALIRAALALNVSARATARPARSQKNPKSAGGAS